MKILVVGGGATGSVIVKALADNPEIDEITCVGKHIRDLHAFIPRHRKIKFAAADAKNSAILERLGKNHDILLNAASPWLNIPLLKLALKLDMHYQDLAADLGFDDGTSKMPYRIEHLPFHKKFKARKKVALFDTGVAPGLTNLIAAQAADKMRLESVVIRMFENVRGGVVLLPWSAQAMIDEIQSRPAIWKNNRFVLVRPFSKTEEFKFPKPFGKKIIYPVMQNESLTLPHYLSVRNVSAWFGGNDAEVSRLMARLGLLEKKKLRIHDTLLSPLEVTTRIVPPPPSPKELKRLMDTGLIEDGFFAISLEIRGVRHGKHAQDFYWINFPSQRELARRNIYATYVAYPSGRCAAAFTPEIMNVKKFGVMPPEGLPKENRQRILKTITEIFPMRRSKS